MLQVRGIHHITAIAGIAQESLDFYVQVLGMRLVKKSINQDAPDTYHLFFADAEGHPGTDLTFFPWQDMAPGRVGAGVWGEVGLVVPHGSLDFWEERLAGYGVESGPRELRFGEHTLPFSDQAGMAFALVEANTHSDQAFTAWDKSPIPPEHQIRALGSVRLTVRAAGPTTAFLGRAYGFSRGETEGSWTRYLVGEGAGGQRIDIRVDEAAPAGHWGTGSVHHVAFRVTDDEDEQTVRSQIIAAGQMPTDVIDRFWFKSVYVREPSGALCEIATDGPGFGVDEDMEHLGESLVLPPWYESQRDEIEHSLPVLKLPVLGAAVGGNRGGGAS